MKLERVLIVIIILGLSYITYTQYHTLTRFFNSNLVLSSFFNQEPRQKELKKVNDNRDEIKEIMELTKLLQNIEEEVNNVYDQYDIIRIDYNQLENTPSFENRLLMDLKNLGETIAYDRIRIADFKIQINSYSSSNKSLNQIKKQYIKILESKDEKIGTLQRHIIVLENELKQTGALLKEQANIITTQKGNIQDQREIIKNREEDLLTKQANIEYQNRVIEKLSVKHIILYSRKETIHLELEGNSFRLHNKINQIEIMSEHPKSSYVLNEFSNGETEFEILNTSAFWNNNNYVLIQVKSRKL